MLGLDFSEALLDPVSPADPAVGTAVRSARLMDAMTNQPDGGTLCVLQRIVKAVALLPIAVGVVRDKAPAVLDGDPELAADDFDHSRAAIFLAHQVSELAERLDQRLFLGFALDNKRKLGDPLHVVGRHDATSVTLSRDIA